LALTYFDSSSQGIGTWKQSFGGGVETDGWSSPKLAPSRFISSSFASAWIIPSVLANKAKIKVYKLEGRLKREKKYINQFRADISC
jgi:hypothetical protein